MADYTVLARKYRPQKFADMVGQQHVLSALENALSSGRLHHAYLLTGTRGVGKTTIARILAKCLNCEKGITAEPCGECASCRAIADGTFPDLIEIDAASRTKVEDTRELLENVQYKPMIGRFKVYIIDEVHMLSNSSFNALLKTLEEPPEYVKFILATTDPQKLPVTVVSRCMQFQLKALSREDIAGQLEHVLTAEGISYEADGIMELARAARGSMRDALSLTDQAVALGNGTVTSAGVLAMIGTLDSSYLADILKLVAEGDGARLHEVLATVASVTPDFDALHLSLARAFHDLALYQMLGGDADIYSLRPEILQALSGAFSPQELQLYYQIVLEGRREFPYAPDGFSAFEMTMLRLLAFNLKKKRTGLRVIEFPALADVKTADPVLAINSIMEEHARQEAQAQAAVETPKKNATAQGISSLQQQVLDKYGVFFSYLDKIDAKLEAQLKLVEQRNLTAFADKERDRKRDALKEEKDQEALRYGRSKLNESPNSLQGNPLASAVEAAAPIIAPQNQPSVTLPGSEPIPGPSQVYVPSIQNEVNAQMGPHLPGSANADSNNFEHNMVTSSNTNQMPPQVVSPSVASQGMQQVTPQVAPVQALQQPPFDGPYSAEPQMNRGEAPVSTPAQAPTPDPASSVSMGQTSTYGYGEMASEGQMGGNYGQAMPQTIQPNVQQPNLQPNGMMPPNEANMVSSPNMVPSGNMAPQPPMDSMGAMAVPNTDNNGYAESPDDIPTAVDAVPVSTEFYGSDFDDEVDAENSRTFTDSDLNLGLSSRPGLAFDKTSYEEKLLGIRHIMKPADYLVRVRDDYTELLMKAGLQELDMSVLGVSVREVVAPDHWIIQLPQESQYLCSRNDYPHYIGDLFSKALGQKVSVEFKFLEAHGILLGSPLALAHQYYDGHFANERTMLLSDPNFQEIISRLNLTPENAHFDLVIAREQTPAKIR